MWRFYLAGSSVGFKEGSNRLFQVTFTKGLRNMPYTRDHLCRVSSERRDWVEA